MVLPTDDVLIPLSPLDAILGHLSLTFIYVFPPMPYDLDRVRSTFVSLVEGDFPLFVGTPHMDACAIRQRSGTHVGAAATIPFEVDAHSELTIEQVVPTPPMSLMPKRDHTSELISVKATRLCDGGLALGINATHALLDGEGLFTFMNLWGMHYRGVSNSQRLVVCHDRQVVMPRGVGFTMPHPEFVQPGVTQSNPTATVEITAGDSSLKILPETTQKVFHITPSQLMSLKRAVKDGLPDGQYVSTIDVVTALFTVLITRARGHGKNVKITTGVNGRTRFNPPLPANYSGNCIFNALSSYTAEELATVSVETVQRVAQRIRASVLRHDEAFLRDAIEFIAQNSGRWNEIHTDVDFIFGPDLMFTSWANIGMYDADFGGGRPLYTGPPRLSHCDGSVIIMEGINHASGLDVLPLLDCEVMDVLTEFWGSCELLHL